MRPRWQAERQDTRCHCLFSRPGQIFDQTTVQVPSFTPSLFATGALLGSDGVTAKLECKRDAEEASTAVDAEDEELHVSYYRGGQKM